MKSLWVGQRYDLTIWQGRTYQLIVTARYEGTPVDLTDFTATAEIRDHPGGELLVSFSTGVLDPELDELVALDDTGDMWLVLADEVTETLDQNGVWDLKLTDPAGKTFFLTGGKVTLKPKVTA